MHVYKYNSVSPHKGMTVSRHTCITILVMKGRQMSFHKYNSGNCHTGVSMNRPSMGTVVTEFLSCDITV